VQHRRLEGDPVAQLNTARRPNRAGNSSHWSDTHPLDEHPTQPCLNSRPVSNNDGYCWHTDQTQRDERERTGPSDTT
jgi:hypothetical protein